MPDRSVDYIQLVKQISAVLLITLSLYFIVGSNFLFFHSLVEGLCIIIGGLIFIVATQTFRFSNDQFLLFIGFAYLFICILDFMHVLTFHGMGIFPGISINTPTQLWIVGRYMEAFSFLLAPFIIQRTFSRVTMFTAYAVVTILSLIAIMRVEVFPTCFVDGVGLTSFKIYSEYIIILMLCAAIVETYRKRTVLHPTIYFVLMASMGFTILSEVCFTLYVSTTDMIMHVGHLLKAVSYFLIFWGIIMEGFDAPYDLIFKELKESNLKLKFLNEKKNQFIGIAAHDLRNPLSIISMSTQILSRSEGLTEKQIKFIDRINVSSEYMLHLVEELLDLSKIEGGKLSLNLEPCNLVNVVENSVSLNQIIATDKQIRLFLKPEAELPNLYLDCVKMEQVVNNLLSNAIKYSYPGSNVQIRMYQKKQEVILVVEDEGQGIPADEVPQIFSPYSKTSVRATAGEKSTGLGLAITRKIVEGHQGRIWVESEVGKGSKFFVALPILLETVKSPLQVEGFEVKGVS